MSVVSEEDGGMEQKFADEGDPVEFHDEVEAGEEPVLEPVPKKKKKVIRRVVKRPREATVAGSALDEAALSAIRTSLYYVSDIDGNASVELQNQLNRSVETSTAATDLVGTIVDSASTDHRVRGKTAAMSLGIEDGVVSDECILPKLLRKLAIAQK
ncbi:hypothetical protein G6O67_002841 [Ophiocordyceps sinensis]|uniref:Uncharacterized protein n=2 Tax=Ophiocordyceps sinensis TaxID=72228 RepID=A0A8H4PV01_9HYPO|nr:hypothetical protein OCS_00215 [Ophiocordyceps sinensis CO18]KAF4511001.1 hypothetical protein G6O67_002841 [Ophiocordyceps sinensis]